MASETIQRPRSNITRKRALNAAKLKLIAIGAGNFLSVPTTAKLNLNQPLYNSASNLVASCASKNMKATNNKTRTVDLQKRANTRFIQVLVWAITDEELGTVADLLLYKLDSNGNVPKMENEAEIMDVAANLIAGEAARVAAGGDAMSNPTISLVINRQTNCTNAEKIRTTAFDAFRNAERALKALNKAVDETLKFIWNEVETHFSNLDKAALRDAARQWGVKYARIGSRKILSGNVLDSVTREFIIDSEVYLFNGKNENISTLKGYKLDTRLMDEQTLISVHQLYHLFEENVALIENENLVYDIIMVRII